MALDGAFLSCLRSEIENVAIGARVDRVMQPSRDILVLHLRWRGGNGKLLLSANADNARVHWTSSSPENPMQPPMFCMLLRKHLTGARLNSVTQEGMDRIIRIAFDAIDELGDPVTLTLITEIMGRHSNIILTGNDDIVLDAIRRVDLETSSVRQILPGIRYRLPPVQNKINILTTDTDEVCASIQQQGSTELSRAIVKTLEGVSPLLSQEIAHRSGARDHEAGSLANHTVKALRGTLQWLRDTLEFGKYSPTMLLEPVKEFGGNIVNRPYDFSFIPVSMYGSAMSQQEYESCSALLDAFYTQRDLGQRMRQRSQDLLKLLSNATDRIERKLEAQRSELVASGNREKFKAYGDLVSANIYALKKGDTVARVVDFYDPDQPEIDIPLEPRLTPVQNVQRYYARYRKAANAEKILTELILKGEHELEYLDLVFDALARAATEAELEGIRDELVQSGYLRRKGAAKSKKPLKLKPLRYVSTDGFTILVGRNNIQNDRLTLRESERNDIWLHTQKIPGSHTIIITDGKQPPIETIHEAAVLAAYNSRARNGSKIPVDYTQVKYVKKPSGAKPGMVIYDNFKTLIVDPDPELADKLSDM